ncbi:MAG TPA: hypothetical protein VFX59_18940 [Polyangiales bacterium]|nr:hypothetical protein [Polyangiales bacterium]
MLEWGKPGDALPRPHGPITRTRTRSYSWVDYEHVLHVLDQTSS